MSTVQILNLILVIIIFVIFILGIIVTLIIIKMRSKKNEESKKEKIETKKQLNKVDPNLISRDGKTINSIYKFMEFDGIKDNMIIRKNHTQYVMAIQCKGINYDLLSEEEKNAVESGFIEFLNTLRFPIQLYIQTRKINFTHILDEYQDRINNIQEQIRKIDIQIEKARGDQQIIDRLQLERRRKSNILEYGESIEEDTTKINNSEDMLQQKTYLIVSYYSAELGDISKYSQEEIDDLAFSELYVRAQTLIRALSSAEVSGEVLESEELAELLYVAYNKDESEKYTLQDALDAQYDRLYSTARDVLEEKKKKIEEQIEKAAANFASKSIINADQKMREEKAKEAEKIKQRAKEMVDEYKGEISKPLYDETMKEINNTKEENILENKENKRRIIRKKI